jgi:hypothetical protein
LVINLRTTSHKRGKWSQAVKCTEYQLNDDEALQMILILQQSRSAWNAFTRVQIALQQESYLQAKAHANQVAGGKDKGWANLPEARQIEVRQEIAYLAAPVLAMSAKLRPFF